MTSKYERRSQSVWGREEGKTEGGELSNKRAQLRNGKGERKGKGGGRGSAFLLAMPMPDQRPEGRRKTFPFGPSPSHESHEFASHPPSFPRLEPATQIHSNPLSAPPLSSSYTNSCL